MKTINRLIVCAVSGLVLLSGPAAAAVTIPAPEPGVFSLLGIGAVIVLGATIRNRRK